MVSTNWEGHEFQIEIVGAIEILGIDTFFDILAMVKSRPIFLQAREQTWEARLAPIWKDEY